MTTAIGWIGYGCRTSYTAEVVRPTTMGPNAVVPRRISVCEGAVVHAGTVIGANASIGRFVHSNRSASMWPHADVHHLVSIGPGAVLAGHVRSMAGSFVGAGAVCAPDVTIGENAAVGSGAVVVRDAPPGALAVGNPARVVRQSDTGHGGVAVPGS